MRRFSQSVIFVTFLGLCFLFDTFAQENIQHKDTRYNFNLAKQKIRVYITNFKNSTEEKEIDLEQASGVLQNTLIGRKDILFSIAKVPGEADMIISCDIKKFDYKETDPIDSYMGSAALVMDMLVKQNYAMMEVEFEIKDARTNKSTFQLVKSKFNKSDMPRHESYVLVTEEIAKDFVREYFYPKKQQTQGPR